MAEATLIKPDLEFVNEIIQNGGDSLKKCYQCATCSVACKVTPDDSPFPRKEMVLAQWGQKEKLLSSPDVWLCHQCGDCTDLCPRGAKPGEVLNAIRKSAIKHVAMIPFLSRIANEPKLLPVLFLIPMAIFGAIQVALGHTSLDAIQHTEAGVMAYRMMMPTHIVDAVFVPTFFFAVFSAFVGIRRLWSQMKAQSDVSFSGKGLMASVMATIGLVLAHKKFAECKVNSLRRIGHSLLFFGFGGLFLTTAWAVIYMYGHEFLGLEPIGPLHFGMPPVPNADPLKMLALASSVAFGLGVLILLINRFVAAGKAGLGSYFDWTFMIVMIGTGLTGMAAWGLRLGEMEIGYVVYYFHLVFIWTLMAYAPYSKFAHMFYRTTALIFADQTGRK